MDTTSMVCKNNLKCGLVRSQHTFLLCISPSQITSGPGKLMEFQDVLDIWHSLCIYQCSNKLCFQTLFQSACTGMAFIQSCKFFMQCHQMDWRSQAFSVSFLAFTLTGEISLDSLNHFIIFWIEDGEIPKFLATIFWEMLVLNYWTICTQFFTKG